MIDINNFDEIRPCNNTEINSAIRRLAKEPLFLSILTFLFPSRNINDFIQELIQVNTADDLQKQMMHPAINSIISQTSSGFSFSGFEYLKPEEQYLFIGNHRDIILDSAILQVKLIDYSRYTSYITFGSNLLSTPLFKDFGGINKMISVNREGTGKEFYFHSLRLSTYIRKLICEEKSSVWIAQRNGRTKDGDDKTQTGLLKMLHMGGEKDLTGSFRKLNIVPVSISYEFEPCASLKTREKYLSSQQDYVKNPKEDMESVVTGIRQYKGRIHLAMCRPVNPDLHTLNGNDNERLLQLATMIDERIYESYKLWPNNYIAADRLNGNHEFSNNYSDADQAKFDEYMNKGLEKIDGDKMQIKNIFLNIYANPVFNQLHQVIA